MGRKPDPCLCCGRDTRREGDEIMGADTLQLRCRCGRRFCISCTENIYKYGRITECPNCGRPIDARRFKASDLADEPEEEKTP